MTGRGNRPAGLSQYVSDFDGELAKYETDPWAEKIIEREPVEDHVECLFIGGGFSALLTAARLRERGVDDLAQVTLMSDGASVYECRSQDEVIDLVQGGQGVFGIAVGRVWREVEGDLAELPSERAEGAETGEPVPGDELAARRAARATG